MLANILDQVGQIAYYALFGWALLYFMSKKMGSGETRVKQRALFFQLILIFILFAGIKGIFQIGLPAFTALAFPVLVIVVAFIFRKQVLPYRFKCSECGANLKTNQIMFSDSELCEKCDPKLKEPNGTENKDKESE